MVRPDVSTCMSFSCLLCHCHSLVWPPVLLDGPLPSGHILPRPLLRLRPPNPYSIAWPGLAWPVLSRSSWTGKSDNAFCRTIDRGSFHPAHVAHYRVVSQQPVYPHPSPAHLRCPVGDSLPRTSSLLFRRFFHSRDGSGAVFLSALQLCFNREYPPSARDMIPLLKGVSLNKSSRFGLTWCTCTVSLCSIFYPG